MIPMLLWTLFVLYPNPLKLVVSLQRAWNPPVDPVAVHELAAGLPDDPKRIEALVNSSIVPYAVPWQTYGVPWYFPTPAEVLAAGQGDCQARAVVLASLLRANGIPATFVGSLDHLWVDYPGKQPTALENMHVALAVQHDDAAYRFNWPGNIDWRQSWMIERAYFWDAMPIWRRALLLGGWIAISIRGAVGRRRASRLRHVSTGYPLTFASAEPCWRAVPVTTEKLPSVSRTTAPTASISAMPCSRTAARTSPSVTRSSRRA